MKLVQRLFSFLFGTLVFVLVIAQTRPRSFDIDQIATKEGWKGTVGSGLFSLLDSTGNIEVTEFHDCQIFTVTKVNVFGKRITFIGLPISGKFYRLE